MQKSSTGDAICNFSVPILKLQLLQWNISLFQGEYSQWT